jgi:hypothetical protein
VRQSAGLRRRRHGKKKVSKEIPIKTFSDWKDPAPGFLEIDFVVHGGGSMSGEYLHSFVGTDVCSGWVEAVPMLARRAKAGHRGDQRHAGPTAGAPSRNRLR